jgi:hypothetical protein
VRRCEQHENDSPSYVLATGFSFHETLKVAASIVREAFTSGELVGCDEELPSTGATVHDWTAGIGYLNMISHTSLNDMLIVW